MPREMTTVYENMLCETLQYDHLYQTTTLYSNHFREYLPAPICSALSLKEKERKKEGEENEKEMGGRGKESERQADILKIQLDRVAKTHRMP